MATMMTSEAKVLITGAAGMVGSHLIDFLRIQEPTWDLHLLLRWQESLDNLEHILADVENPSVGLTIHYGDLRDLISLEHICETISFDYVFHLAAQSFPKTSFSNPIETYDCNIQGTENLLYAIHKHSPSAKVHVCSSSEVYGQVSKEEFPISESCRFHPASPYAISKVGTDLIGQHYAQAYDLETRVTRMFTHTGPRRGDVFAESTFAKQIAMIEAGVKAPIVKVGNLDSLRTWADVRDAVRAYHLLLTHDGIMRGDVFNIGGATVKTIGEMLEHLLSLSKVSGIRVEQDETRLRPIDADLQVPDTSKFSRISGWEPEIPFEKTMEDLLDYWRQRVRNRQFLSR